MLKKKMISFISFIHSFIHSFQLVYISHYVFFILVQMQFDTRFVFVMAPFSSRYSVGWFNFYMVYFKLRFQFATYFSLALIAGFTVIFFFFNAFNFQIFYCSLSRVTFPLFPLSHFFLHGFERFHFCDSHLCISL